MKTRLGELMPSADLNQPLMLVPNATTVSRADASLADTPSTRPLISSLPAAKNWLFTPLSQPQADTNAALMVPQCFHTM